MKLCCMDTFIQAFDEVIDFIEKKQITTIEDILGVLKGSARMLKKTKVEQLRRAGITDDNINI